MPPGVSLKGPAAADPSDPTPLVEPPYWLEVSATRDWGDFVVCPDLRPVRCVRLAGSMGRSRLEFYFTYGPKVFEEFDAEQVAIEKYEDLAGHWVRLMIPFDDDPISLFTGRVEAPLADVDGDQTVSSDDELVPQGVQRWVAYGAERVLERVTFNESWWIFANYDGYQLDSVPDFNLQGDDPAFVGNRSDGLSAHGCHLFGGTTEWSAYGIDGYAFKMILEQDGAGGSYDGPAWYLGGGQLQYLLGYKPRIRMAEVSNLLALERRLMSNRIGLDFVIQDVDDGFETEVFALVPDSPNFAGYSGPVNNDRYMLNVSYDWFMTVKLEYSQTARVDRIRLAGDFCRVVMSLGDTAQVPNLVESLVEGWLPAEETAYEAGDVITGSPTPADHDAARAAPRFEDVYCKFVAPADFTFAGGDANPRFTPDGVLVLEADRYQAHQMATLPQLPLEQAVDYTVDPPANRRPVGQSAEYLPPLVLIKEPNSGRYVQLDQIAALRPDLPNAAIYTLDNDLGFRLRINPNHVMAKNQWASGSPAGTLLPDPGTQGLEYDRMVVTLAMETDHRVIVEVALPAAVAAGDGSVHVDHVPMAQFWWLAPYTVVGVDSGGVLEQAPAAGTILRDDRNLLCSMMPGAIARYLERRVRCTVTRKGWLEPWHWLIGQMLDLYGEQNTLDELLTPVTTVVWTFEGSSVSTQMLAGQRER